MQQNLYALELELEKVLDDQQKGKFEHIKSRIDQLLKLINSWLRVISVDISQLKNNFKPVSVIEPINNAIESLSSLAERKDIIIKLVIDKDLPPLLGDSLSLSEVFVNVIGNSIKYSPSGSKVAIRGFMKGSELSITIKDEGIGIPPEDLPHIFEGFYRGKSTKESTGHGIGLAVARQIVEAHGGSIMVDSEVNKGTTFSVIFPVHQD